MRAVGLALVAMALVACGHDSLDLGVSNELRLTELDEEQASTVCQRVVGPLAAFEYQECLANLVSHAADVASCEMYDYECDDDEMDVDDCVDDLLDFPCDRIYVGDIARCLAEDLERARRSKGNLTCELAGDEEAVSAVFSDAPSACEEVFEACRPEEGD